MTAPRPFRFGVQCTTAPDRASWIDLARRVEDLGYAVLTMPDHFDAQLAPVPALMCAADATTSLRVGALVWDNDYKHPVVLAKELATMDLLSEGRLEIGVGAGWKAADYEQAGIPFDPPGARIDRFEEGIQVVKGLLGDGPFTFAGRHYAIDALDGTPKPVQQPRPPMLIGGGGTRVLGIAAREADIVGINGTLHAGVIGAEAIATMTADAVDDKVAIVRKVAGHRMADIEMNIRVFVVNVTNDRAGAVAALSGAVGVDPAMIEESPFALVGPPSKLVDDLLARRERWGLSYIVVGGDDVAPFAPVVAALAGRS